jgi:hypothetical protein
MKKSIVSIIILVIMASILVGCGNTSSTTESAEPVETIETAKEFSDYGERIKLIGTEFCSGLRITYYYDTVLNVVYMHTYMKSGAGSSMVVTDLNGVPVSYEDFIAQYENIE